MSILREKKPGRCARSGNGFSRGFRARHMRGRGPSGSGQGAACTKRTKRTRKSAFCTKRPVRGFFPCRGPSARACPVPMRALRRLGWAGVARGGRQACLHAALRHEWTWPLTLAGYLPRFTLRRRKSGAQVRIADAVRPKRFRISTNSGCGQAAFCSCRKRSVTRAAGSMLTARAWRGP